MQAARRSQIGAGLLAAGVLAVVFGWVPLASAQAIKVGSFTKSTAGAPVAQVVPHGLGQTPKALILWTDGKADESFSTDFLYALGMADGTTSKSVALASRTTLAAPVAGRRLANKALTIVDWTQTPLAEADLTSWDATSFTLNWTTNNATAYVVHFIVIGGASVSAKVVGWTMGAVTGNKVVNTVGFTPDVVLHAHLGYDFTAAAPANSADAHFGLGAMDKSGSQWANAVLSVNGVAANTQRGQQTDGALYDFNGVLAVQKKASFVSMDASGFTVNFTNATSGLAGQVISLALKGVSAKAGSFLKSTTLPPAGAYVQSTSANFGAVASGTLTLPGASTSGDLLVLGFNTTAQTVSVASVTDNKGNSWLRAAGPTDWASGRMHSYYAKNITGGAGHQITITLSGGNAGAFFEVYAAEYRGVDAIDPLDQVAVSFGTEDPLTSGAVATSRPDEVLTAYCEGQNPLTVNAPFTPRQTLNNNFLADLGVTSVGIYNVTASNAWWTNYACHLLAFRHSGTAQAIPGVGFSPQAVLLASVQDAAQGSPVAHARLGFGAADRDFSHGSSALADNDLSGPTSVQGIDKTSRAFVKVNNNTSTVNAEAVLGSMDLNGFTLDWTANDAVATQMLYLALEAPKPDSYKRFRSITVPTSSLGASCTSSLSSFPMLVSLPSDLELRRTTDGGYVQNASGWDIVFSDASNNLLDFEIEQYTSAPGGAKLVAWVRVPTLSNLASTTIFMRYGKTGVASPSANPAGVWQSGFRGVWHMREDPSGAAPQMKDSTPYLDHGSSVGTMTSGDQVAGAIGGSLDFDGSDDQVVVPYTANLDVVGSITLEAWVKTASNGNVVSKIGSASQQGYILAVGGNTGSNNLISYWSNWSWAYSNTTVTDNAWHHIAVVHSGTTATFYRDGVPDGTVTQPLRDLNSTEQLQMGLNDNSGCTGWLAGLIDEVRVSSAPRSQCWIETEYKDQSSPPTFYTLGTPTAVTLQSFDAAASDGAVSLTWRTASELSNVGFYAYRGLSASGPWTRLNASLIPGLGSSAVGQAYSFRDAGLVNGTRYFYRLEDVDASSKVTSHGPVSAVPVAAAAGGAPGSEPPSSGASTTRRGGSSPSCPDWVVAAYGSMAGASASASVTCTRHGDPEAVSLSIVSRDSRQATLELKTGGFYALHASEPLGQVRVFVPGFDFSQDPQAPALPLRRALVDAVVGRRAQLGGVRALEQVSFPGLVPLSLGKAEMQVSLDGTVRAARRALPASSPEHVSMGLARLLPSVFQGETKSAVVQITPLRYDARRKRIVLSRRVLVQLLFTGRETGESGRGSFGRRERQEKLGSGELLARLYTTSRGLYAVSFEQLFPGRRQGFASSQLRLERQGQAQAIHVACAASLGACGGPDVLGPGGVLYFYSDTAASSIDFSSETAWELLRARDGVAMPLVSAAPSGVALTTASTAQAGFEKNRFYQPGLLEAPEPWLWEALASGATRAESFSLAGVSPASSSAAMIEVFLQGASESGNAIDHHVSVSLNGTPVGEAQFAGKKPFRMSLSVAPSLLLEGANTLSLTNVGDTGVSSMAFLDRFTVAYPQTASLASGRFEGTWNDGGTAAVSGASGPVALLDVTLSPIPGTSPTTAVSPGGAFWLGGYASAGGSLRFRAEAGHRYLAVSQQALLTPRVAAPAASSLRSTQNQADYLLIAPRAFLATAEPLLQRRTDQGLAARAVAFEEITDEFGGGQPSAEAIRSFVAYAYQSWARPSPRYVLLLGDSSYDPRNFTGSSQPSPLPALWTKTSYLWTVSDPELAAVNGDDELPDLAIGRLPATTLEQASSLVQKLTAWEDSGQGLNGAAALVADNPDPAGNFDADIDDIAHSFLEGREVRELKLSELGGAMRPAIQDAMNSGLSQLSYVGHGGAAVWASENVWNSWDAASLQPQSRQPFLMTMNCLNGYFVAPAFDSLAESLLKAEGRGAVASFSPSGLSEDGPAHQYHRALMAELTSGRHARLGDAVLAAQKVYAQTGLMPELLSVYHLLGDPAMRIR